MSGKHYATIGMLLGALALMIAGLHSWHEALTPPFIAGVLAAVAAVLKGMYQDKPDGGAPSVDVQKLAPVLLLAAALGGAPVVLAGCAGNHAPVLTPTQAAKALDAVHRTGDIIAAVQASEIAFYQAGDVPAATHQQIQAALAKASSTVLTALDALQTAGTGDPHDVVAAVRDAVKSLSATFAHLSAQSAAKLSAVLDTAAALVDLALAS